MNLSESYKKRLKLLSGIISESEVENAIDLNKMVHAYLHAALWTSELDSNYDIEEIDHDSISKAVADCKKFIEMAGDLLNGLEASDVGHDFWLSRNGHGAGFFDRGIGEVGDKLQELARSFGTSDVMEPEEPGDSIYIS